MLSRRFPAVRPLRAVPCRRYVGTSVSPPGVAAWIDEITRRPPTFSTDEVDPRRVLHLQQTLPTRVGPSSIGLPISSMGDVLPHAHHMVLLQPQTPLDQLGLDGSSTKYNAPSPFLRRMWAGGTFDWNPAYPLAIGQKVTEMTRVEKVEFKNNMIFVHQEKKLLPGEGQSWGDDFSLKEIRTHVFRTTEDVSAINGVKKPLLTPPPTKTPTLTFTYTPTSPLLFRYSALTFNGHRIHYDRDWARNVEGHPDTVVHGPLTSTLLVELASKIALDSGRNLSRFEYRATNPMYVDREISLKAYDKEGVVDLLAEQEGMVGMRATAWLA